MIWFIILGIIIVIGVLALSVMTTSKGYAYKHTVDPLPTVQEKEEQQNDHNGREQS
ncbi:YtzI protein [Ornithinibacillus contaminans]|uniref:YtzI protein n=1 Tax=Ornithinibacillus contaminans TaxID=694055 RepID=UPI0009FB2D01|nr:YtzI protein [Ornithinibacillus contaminans]